MLSRILWIGLAVIALVAGLAFQNRLFFSRDHDEARERVEVSATSIEDRIVDRMTVVHADGRRVEVPRETKRAMAEAVTSFISAKTELALLRARHADPQEVLVAQRRSDAAHARLEQVKADIDRQRELSRGDRDALRAQIQQDVREAVRETVGR